MTDATSQVLATNTRPALTESERLNKANSIIKDYMIGAMVGACVPVPLVDLVLLTSVQLKMVHSLANLYGIPFSRQLVKSAIGSLVGGVVTTNGAIAIGSSMAKMIPGFGLFAGMLSMSVLSGATTYAVGKVFVTHFESGGTFLDFDPEKVRQHFEAALTEGKAKAAEEQPKAAAAVATTAQSLTEGSAQPTPASNPPAKPATPTPSKP